MTVRTPEEVYQLFAEALNAGDIEALMALYEPDAVFVTDPGHPVTGTEQLRGALEGILAPKGTIRLANRGIVRGHDLAFMAARWRLALDNSWGADTVQAG